jgi:hypothetical protein
MDYKNLTIKFPTEDAKAHLLSLVDKFAEKVAPIYEMLQWEWFTDKSVNLYDYYVPDIEEIKKTCIYLIGSVLNENYHNGEYYYNRESSTGGIKVIAKLTSPHVWSYYIVMEIDESIHTPVKDNPEKVEL